MADKFDYEIVSIREPTLEERKLIADYKIVESPWITIHNGITGEYYQLHRETGETRDVPVDWWDCGGVIRGGR